MRREQTWVLVLGVVVSLGGAAVASAQTLEQEQSRAEQRRGLAAPGSPARLDDAQADAEDEAPIESSDDTDPREHADTDYFFLGAFARGIVIPGFIQGLFVDGGIDGFNPGAGLSFNYRRNNFNVLAQVWWNGAVADGYLRANGDPRTDTEYIDVDLGVLFVNAAFLWSFPVDEQNIFAIELGFDLGFGLIYGNLVRTEAYESSPGSGDFQPCNGPGDPNGSYCEPSVPDPSRCHIDSGGHYNCTEPNWLSDGGDTPLLFPWVALPHIAVRIKPIRQLQIRIDGGYGLYNFFFGGSLSYGF